MVQHVDGDDWFGIYLEPVHEDCVAGKKRTGVTFQLRLHASAGEPVCKTGLQRVQQVADGTALIELSLGACCSIRAHDD